MVFLHDNILFLVSSLERFSEGLELLNETELEVEANVWALVIGPFLDLLLEDGSLVGNFVSEKSYIFSKTHTENFLAKSAPHAIISPYEMI